MPFVGERRRRIQSAMREQLQEELRASAIARRRAEEERADMPFVGERRRRRRIQSAMREQLQERVAREWSG
jgi:hypothetical protein